MSGQASLRIDRLERIRDHILAEPKRLAMWSFENVSGTLADEDQVPPCKTACCIGGWAWIFYGNGSPLMDHSNVGRIVLVCLVDGVIGDDGFDEIYDDLESLFLDYPSAMRPLPAAHSPWFGLPDAGADSAAIAINRVIEKHRGAPRTDAGKEETL